MASLIARSMNLYQRGSPHCCNIPLHTTPSCYASGDPHLCCSRHGKQAAPLIRNCHALPLWVTEAMFCHVSSGVKADLCSKQINDTHASNVSMTMWMIKPRECQIAQLSRKSISRLFVAFKWRFHFKWLSRYRMTHQKQQTPLTFVVSLNTLHCVITCHTSRLAATLHRRCSISLHL